MSTSGEPSQASNRTRGARRLLVAGVAAVAAVAAAAACGGDGIDRDHAVRVTVGWAGASPVVVERELVEPLEEATTGLPGVRGLRSEAREGRATIDVLVENGRALDGVAAAVRDAVTATLRRLPTDADPPVVQKLTRPARTLLAVIPGPADQPLVERGQRLDALRLRLEAMAGVGRVTVCGGADEEVRISVDLARLAASGVGIDQVVDGLRAMNVTIPAGRIDAPPVSTTLRVAGRPDSLAGVGAVAVSDRVRVADVAQVERAPVRPCVATTRRGQGDALVEVALRSRDAEAEIVKVLRAEGGELLAGDVVLGEIEVAAATLEQRARIAAHLIDAGATAARTPAEPATIEVVIADAAGAAGEQRLAALEAAIAATPGSRLRRWRGRPIRALEQVTIGPDVDPGGPFAPALQLTVDRPRADRLGVSAAAIATAVAVVHGGVEVGESVEQGRAVPIRVVAPATDPAEAVRLPLRTSTGASIPLDQVATVTLATEPGRIVREDRQRAVVGWRRVRPGEREADVRRALAGDAGATVRAAEPDRDRW
ncbi:MAG TPA: efflux RND transporter permease subunit [Kofleriaceae bacterium]|nr:efflux RND transporter permease subunit [Kofleriaceae bacterium]